MGVASVLLVYPEEEICVAIMVNSMDCSGIYSLGMNIAKYVYDNLKARNDGYF